VVRTILSLNRLVYLLFNRRSAQGRGVEGFSTETLSEFAFLDGLS